MLITPLSTTPAVRSWVAPQPVAEPKLDVPGDVFTGSLTSPSWMSTEAPAAPPPSAPQVLPSAPTVVPTHIPMLEATARGYDRANLDPTVRPQDNFFQYAVGGSLARHPIPSDRATYGVDAVLVEQTQEKLRSILERARASRPPCDSEEQKIGDYYASGMDTARIEQAGLTPLQPLLNRIESMATLADLQDALGELHRHGLSAMFSFGPTPDAQNPDMVIGEAFQGGLGLPERDYYLSEEKAEIRQKYEQHVARMFELMGDAQAAEKAAAVLRVETRLAEASLSRVELRDPTQLYHMHDRNALRTLTPSFDWSRYFAQQRRPDIQSINVATPSFFTALEETLKQVPMDDWKAYMTYRVLDPMASYLPAAFEDEDFNFSGRILMGVEQQAPRWKRVVRDTDGVLGFALGKKFVEENFSPQARARVLEMVDNVKVVLREAITNSDMTPATKQEALAKVDTFKAKIGYPDVWKDYSNLHVSANASYAENALAASRFHAAERMRSIGRPVDKNEWEMTPGTVNAYYHPLKNEIVFPAAILQPPYFDMEADDAANYGATGATIGHELTHGFDDEGAQFDAQGRLRNWWQAEDKARFEAKARGVEEQFNEFQFEGTPVNGKLVTGESIADLGGLQLAYAAFKRAQEGKPQVQTDDGFTPDQRFFLNYALSWATNVRPEYAQLMLATDPHPLPQFRVLGPLANLPQFHAAFNCQPGDPMVRPVDKRNSLWTI